MQSWEYFLKEPAEDNSIKILQTLTRDNKVVSSVRGHNGGFYLTEKSKELPVRSILQARESMTFWKNVYWV
jgi:DNA-binding IscR family transcriptional regulator